MKKQEQQIKQEQDLIKSMQNENKQQCEAIKKANGDKFELQRQLKKKDQEIAVLKAEKISLKKEIERLDKSRIRLTRDHKSMKSELDVKLEEMAKLEKQNQEYQLLLLENDSKMSDDRQKILEMTKKILAANQEVQNYKSEQAAAQK